MKALVYTAPHSLEMRTITPPSCSSTDDVIVKVEACGICGSDLHAWHGYDDRRPAPLVLGHEAIGTIIEGSDTGQRVAINPLVTCGCCKYCLTGRDNLCAERQIISMPPRPGAFAEYLSIPKRNLVHLPDDVAATAAALSEPLACGWHAVRLATGALKVEISDARIVVIGGGAIGLGAALALDIFGAKDIYVLETNARRHKALKAAGEFTVLDPNTEGSTLNNSADLVIDAVGFGSTRAYASSIASSGGVIVHIGLGDACDGLDIRRMTLQEITFIGTYTYSSEDFRDTAEAIFEGHYGTLDWVDVRPLADGPEAFKEIGDGRAAAPKIILQP